MLHFICHTHNLTLAHPLQLFLQKLLLFSRFLEFFFPVCKCRFFCFDFCLQLAFPINLPVQFIPQIFILTDILNKLGRNAIAFVVNPVINPDLFITGIPEFQNRRSKEIIISSSALCEKAIRSVFPSLHTPARERILMTAPSCIS